MLKERMDLGHIDHQEAVIPRAPRSIRRKSSFRKILEEEELCSFDLLATVAENLSNESEGSASSNAADGKIGNQPEIVTDDKAFESESFDCRRCAESIFISSDPLKKLHDESEVHSQDGIDKIVDSSVSTVKDLTEGCVNTNSNRIVKLPLYREPIPRSMHRKHWKNVKLGVRDDDENPFWCSKYSTRVKPHRPQSCIGQRRIKKVSTSKYWKAAPKFNDYELYTTNEGMKAFYRYRKSIYERERCQNASLKKWKLCDHRFAVAYDSDTKHGISDIRQKAADVASDCIKVHSKAKDHVAFSIKSFKVPELYLDVPESATIGSLKRTVLEAITAVLGGGIRVGIVFQGRKIRGDSKTLQQAGISQCSNLDNLGFTLEPNLARINRKKIPVSPVTNPDTVSSDNMLIDKPGSENMALVPVSSMKEEALAAVPVNQKPIKGAAEASQRRTRRPFSVAEVEALVEAVEKLGTGRWRDIKTLAFENADHRTYVDLKDKWKTLVHTATIAPQQRRGEPVPHELLNRVLSAHSYWSLKQQYGKP